MGFNSPFKGLMLCFEIGAGCLEIGTEDINLLAPELFFLILAHPVYKM